MKHGLFTYSLSERLYYAKATLQLADTQKDIDAARIEIRQLESLIREQ